MVHGVEHSLIAEVVLSTWIASDTLWFQRYHYEIHKVIPMCYRTCVLNKTYRRCYITLHLSLESK